MAYTPVSWSRRDAITSQKLQDMANNDAYFKDNIDNRLPWGILDRVQINTSATGNVQTWDVDGLALTGVSVGANRTIRASATWRNLATQGMVGIFAVQIWANNHISPAGVIAEQWYNATTNLTVISGGTLFVTGTTTTATTIDYKVRVYRVYGNSTGNILMECSNTARAELVVEDMGPST